MAEVIAVRFKDAGKAYYFDPKGQKVAAGLKVVVDTARGPELGEVVIANQFVDDQSVVKPLRELIRVADADDLRRDEENKKKERKKE